MKQQKTNKIYGYLLYIFSRVLVEHEIQYFVLNICNELLSH